MPLADPFWFVLGGIAGALFTLTMRGGLRWWQYRRELWLGHIERLIQVLDQIAERGADYWLTKSETLEQDTSGKEPDSSVAKHEVRVLGLIIRLDGIFAAISERLSAADSDAIALKMNQLTDALTGGAFGTRDRDVEPDRARLAQTYASELIVLVTGAADRALTVSGSARFLRERAYRRARDAGHVD